jgi:DNA invertase Pin-like site-specific DNA recombinase
MNKITPEHLAREAYVYVRQSTADQLLNNPESRRRQYALVARARALGWENAIVIDDDLGRSGDGQLRPGFERLLAAICAGTVGAVLRSRRRGWPATAAIGTRSWNSAPS